MNKLGLFKKLNLLKKNKPIKPLTGFTVVELLVVVVVVVGVLASVTMVSYSGIRQRAVESSIQANLATASKQLQMFQTSSPSGQYPSTLNCTLPNSDTNLCVDIGQGNSASYIPNNVAAVPSFSLTVTSDNSIAYVVTNNSSPTSTAEAEIDGPWKQVTTGNYHACGIGMNDLAYCWGRNTNGQLGDNSVNQSNVPVPVYTAGVLSGKTIKYISAGGWHTCVIASDDNVYCWGRGDNGQLGNNAAVATNQVPVQVYRTAGPFLGKTVKKIAAGSFHVCAIASDDKVYCWGDNALSRQIGDGTTVAQRNVPTAVNTTTVLNGKTIKRLSTTSNGLHTCVIDNTDLLACWGKGLVGELGNNAKSNSSLPVAPVMTGDLSGKTIKEIAVGLSRTCVIASDNLAYCWGAATLGNNTTLESIVPDQVYVDGVLSGKTLVSIIAGSNNVCALDSNSVAYCWGNSSSGILGNNSIAAVQVPVYVDMTGNLTGKTISSIASGAASVCALTTRHNLYCWGSNVSGRLGNNSIIDSMTPVQVVSY